MESNPLKIREIVANVLRFATPRTLLAAAQVNSLWADEATNWLWRGEYHSAISSFARALQLIASSSPERRLWYTAKIRHLSIDIEHDGLKKEPELMGLLATGQLSFPDLRSVIVDIGSENMHEEKILPLLSPTLITLELYGGYYTSKFLDEVKIRSPSLKFFLVDNSLEDSITADTFMEFLHNMPSIVHLELLLGWSFLRNKTFLKHMMLSPRLEILVLGNENEISNTMVKEALLECGDNPIFPVLRYLGVYIEDKALRSLLPFLRNVQGLRLDVSDPEVIQTQKPDIMGLLSASPQLEDLEFGTRRPSTISSAAFLELASGCPMLRRLEIGDECDCDSDFNDALIEKLSSRWKNLAVLSLPFQAGLTHRSLAHLARNCPELVELSVMDDVFNVEEGESVNMETPILPNLNILKMGQLNLDLESESEAATASKNTIAILDKRFPALQSFFHDSPTTNRKYHIFNRLVAKHLMQTRPIQLFPPAYPATSVSQELHRKLLAPNPTSRFNSAF